MIDSLTKATSSKELYNYCPFHYPKLLNPLYIQIKLYITDNLQKIGAFVSTFERDNFSSDIKNKVIIPIENA